MNALLERINGIFARELSPFDILIIVQRELDCDPFLEVMEGLVNVEPRNRFGRIGISALRICTFLNERLDGFINLVQAGFGQWNSTVFWFEHRLHA